MRDKSGAATALTVTAPNTNETLVNYTPPQTAQPGFSGLVSAQTLLVELFDKRNRPSVAWLRYQTKAGKIPSVKVGRLIFYNVPTVMEALSK